MNLFNRLLKILIFLYLNERNCAAAKGGLDMAFDNCTCTAVDPESYLSLLSCSVSKNQKRRTFSIELKFKKEVKLFHINMKIVLPRKNEADFVLFNLTNLNGCELLMSKNQVTFVQLGRSLLDRFGNIPHQCPFRKDVLYYIRGFRLDMSMLPAFTFETAMILWFDILVERKKIFQGYMESHIYMKNKGKFF